VPKSSLPTRPIMATSPPSAPAANAWLAPFPPQVIVKSLPMSVSPGPGKRSTVATRSVFRLPMTRMSWSLILGVDVIACRKECQVRRDCFRSERFLTTDHTDNTDHQKNPCYQCDPWLRVLRAAKEYCLTCVFDSKVYCLWGRRLN
jgi:hypothetical protein